MFDSIYRFICSQNTAHSNYLLVYALATITYTVTFLVQEQLRLILIFMSVPFALLGILLYGRLLYYIELGHITQDIMGLSDRGVRFSQQYFDLVVAEQKRRRGFLSVVTDSLYCRISDSRTKQFDFKDYENFKETAQERTRSHPIGKLKALFIACSNSFYDRRYRIVLIKFTFGERGERK